MARYIDADALQAQLDRKKAGVANQRYTEGVERLHDARQEYGEHRSDC